MSNERTGFWDRVKSWFVQDAPEEHTTMEKCLDDNPVRVIRGTHKHKDKKPKKDGMKHLRAVAKSITEEHEHADD